MDTRAAGVVTDNRRQSHTLVLLLADELRAFDAEVVRWPAGARVGCAAGQAEARAVPGRNALTAAAISPHGLTWFRVSSPPAAGRSSKRGNKYLRRQLIHGARAALPYVAERDTPLG